jgi:response regulator NasT
LLAQVVAGLGHEVIARTVEVKEVGAVTTKERPDIALVGLGLSSEHALELIAEIVHTAACPVVALLTAKDSSYIREAAKRGVFAYIVDGDAEELQSAIDITLQRFAEYHNLQGAFGRRAVIEQAKGILMARHGVDERGSVREAPASTCKYNGRVRRTSGGRRREPSPKTVATAAGGLGAQVRPESDGGRAGRRIGPRSPKMMSSADTPRIGSDSHATVRTRACDSSLARWMPPRC